MCALIWTLSVEEAQGLLRDESILCPGDLGQIFDRHRIFVRASTLSFKAFVDLAAVVH
jgi:hypothetical protein